MLAAIATSLFVGFLTGLWAFKVKSRWCPKCGTSTFAHEPSSHG